MPLDNAPMLTFNKLIARGRGLAPVLLKRAATVELDWDVRQKSRFDATDSLGRTLGVFLPRGTVLRGGDVLVAEDGTLLRVIAAPQAVLQVTYCAEHGSPFDLLRAAYHLGNRHVTLELQADRLQFEPDHVLAEMLRAMHLNVSEALAPFEPEAGAYAARGGHAQPSAHEHEHGYGHGHGNEHGHGPSAERPAHSHEPRQGGGQDHGAPPATGRGRPVGIPVQAARAAAPAPHVHGPGCGHDHKH